MADLLAMARHNLGQAGFPAEEMIAPWRGREAELQALVEPIAIDGRLHPHEWIVDGAGRWLKTDALDHHAAHDLVGCQDAGWDVAGAAVEFGLDAAGLEDLRARVERAAGRTVDARSSPSSGSPTRPSSSAARPWPRRRRATPPKRTATAPTSPAIGPPRGAAEGRAKGRKPDDGLVRPQQTWSAEADHPRKGQGIQVVDRVRG